MESLLNRTYLLLDPEKSGASDEGLFSDASQGTSDDS